MKKVPIQIIVILALMVELGMLTFFRNDFGPFISPVILFLASLTIGISLLWISFQNKESPKHLELQKIPMHHLIVPALLTLSGIIAAGLILKPVFSAFPIDIYDVKYSDIIPQVGFLVKRFLNGEFPYQTISEWGYDLRPTYLPLQWLPFSIADILSFDYRWIPFGILAIGIIWFEMKIIQAPISILKKVLLSLIPVILWVALILDEKMVFALTIESLIAGYYLILALTLSSKSNIVIAVGLLLCLFSRYAIILWVPMFIITLFFENKKSAIRISIYLFIGFLVIYGIPFLYQDPSIFLEGYLHHTSAALGEWKRMTYQVGSKPNHLFKGVGLAAFFYDFIDGSLMHRLNVLRYFHLAVSISCPLILGFLYYKMRGNINYRLFLLASLKVYLCFFYGFIQIPYTYLFITPLFVSAAIAFEVLKYGSQNKTDILSSPL